MKISSEDFGEYILRVEHPSRQKRVQKYTMISNHNGGKMDKITEDVKKENENDQDSSYPLCSDRHDLDECKTLNEVIAEERIKFLYKETLSCC